MNTKKVEVYGNLEVKNITFPDNQSADEFMQAWLEYITTDNIILDNIVTIFNVTKEHKQFINNYIDLLNNKGKT